VLYRRALTQGLLGFRLNQKLHECGVARQMLRTGEAVVPQARVVEACTDELSLGASRRFALSL
jgi:hypothetical protein